jgi:hypothetical protein
LSALAVLALGSGVFLAACGGDDDDDGDETPAATATASDDDEPTNDDTTAEPTEDGGDGGGSGGDPEDVKDAARRFIEATYRGEYRVIGDDPDLAGGTMTLYKDGDRVRFDLAQVQDGEEVEVIFISAEGETGFCLSNAGELGEILDVPEGEGVCFGQAPGGDTGLASLTEELERLENADIEVLETSQRTIAGKEAECYRIRESGEVSEACISDDGELLYTVDADGSGIEATALSGDIPDGVFDLPYELREFPNFTE